MTYIEKCPFCGNDWAQADKDKGTRRWYCGTKKLENGEVERTQICRDVVEAKRRKEEPEIWGDA